MSAARELLGAQESGAARRPRRPQGLHGAPQEHMRCCHGQAACRGLLSEAVRRGRVGLRHPQGCCSLQGRSLRQRLHHPGNCGGAEAQHLGGSGTLSRSHQLLQMLCLCCL